MSKKNQTSFKFSFESSKTPKEIHEHLLNIRLWWSGMYNEEIKGTCKAPNDVFTFSAGDGMHYSKQKLIESIPGKVIVWQVTESKLSFISKEDEWTDTQLVFEIEEQAANTKITFTHVGLIPEIECYTNCSNAWMLYLEKLSEQLK